MIHLLLCVIYLSFVSLGLPDALLGAAWPTMYPQFGVPVSYAGVISMIISAGTIVSSLLSHRMTLRFGSGRVTAYSVATTALALFGFSLSGSFWMLCLWAIPYGLGAGCVDASLNNYVAVHYESKHMSWLHCMWGIGATTGPYIMGSLLSGGFPWNDGYRLIGLLQVLLTAVLFLTLPLWDSHSRENAQDQKAKVLTLRQIAAIPGIPAMAVSFFCYCALETTAGLWASSYLNLCRGIPADTAAGFAGMFYLGITLGRGLCGFLTMKLDDTRMSWLGMGVITGGVGCLMIPGSGWLALAGLLAIGLGCAPIYPCMIHATPARFGAHRSQSIIGVQMASAYLGTLAMPPVFGFLARRLSIGLLPWFLGLILAVMAWMFAKLVRKTGRV